MRTKWRARALAVALAMSALAAGAVGAASPAQANTGDPIESSYIGYAEDTYDHQFKCPQINQSQMPHPDDVSYCTSWTRSVHDTNIWIQWYVEHRHTGAGTDGRWIINSEKYSYDGVTLTDLGYYVGVVVRDCVFPWFWQQGGTSSLAFTGLALEPYSFEPRHGNHVKYANCDVAAPGFTEYIYPWDSYANGYDNPINWSVAPTYSTGGGYIYHYLNEMDQALVDHWDPIGVIYQPAGTDVMYDTAYSTSSNAQFAYGIIAMY